MPSLLSVTAKATMSGTGVSEAESKSVFSPTLMGAGSVSAQSKLNCTSVERNRSSGGHGKDKALCRTGGDIHRRVGQSR